MEAQVQDTNENKTKTNDSEVATVKDTAENEGQCVVNSAIKVVYNFCDLQQKMVDAWKDEFTPYIPDRVQVYKGDIFKSGPSTDAIVSPANSFGFMDGGIDMAYSRHFGWQMQERLQKLIRDEYNGELLVGNAAIITTIEHHNRNAVDWSKYNEGQPIKYLISAPTMRVPMDVSDTSNAYLAFRAIILAVQKFNATNTEEPIRSVLCPGLGTAVGNMPRDRCAYQMLTAYETFEMGLATDILHPDNLAIPMVHHYNMAEFGGEEVKRGPPKDKPVVKSSDKRTTRQLKSEAESELKLKFKTKPGPINSSKGSTSTCSNKGPAPTSGDQIDNRGRGTNAGNGPASENK